MNKLGKEAGSLNQRIFFYCRSHDAVKRIFAFRCGGLACERNRLLVALCGKFQEIVGANVLQKQVESRTVVMMTQMAEFVQKHIVAKHTGKSDEIEIKAYVTAAGAAAPI